MWDGSVEGVDDGHHQPLKLLAWLSPADHDAAFPPSRPASDSLLSKH